MTPDRPALPAVLAHLTRYDDMDLTEFWRVALDPSKTLRSHALVTDTHVSTEHEFPSGMRLRHIAPQRWTVATTADAMERLVSAEVLPAAFVGDESRAFWCRGCAGNGRLIPTDTYAGGECPLCRGDATRPSTMPDLVAWASLGAATILRAEEYARDAARRCAPWGVKMLSRRVVWGIATPSDRGPVGWPRAPILPSSTGPAYQAAHKRHLRAGESSLLAWARAHVEVWPDALPPCPWAPLADLLTLGLTLDAITDDALVVVVPPINKETP